MADEMILRTSVFGGFKRGDVLTYVEELKSEIETLKDALSKKHNDIEKLNSSVAELGSQCKEMKAFEQRFLEKSDELFKLNEENIALSSKINELKMQNEEYEKSQAEIEKTRENLKTTEYQLGAAFLDARKYSEEIVTAANAKATDVSKMVSTDISAQAAEISRLTADVDKIALTFSKSIEELHNNISSLAKKMAYAASSLTEREGAVFLPDVSIKVESQKQENRTASDDTLTFTGHPSSNEFSADLNISPKSVYRFDKKKEG